MVDKFDINKYVCQDPDVSEIKADETNNVVHIVFNTGDYIAIDENDAIALAKHFGLIDE